MPGGSYALTARAFCSSGLATNSSAVTVQVASGPDGKHDHVAFPHDRQQLPNLWQRFGFHRHGHRQRDHPGRDRDFQGRFSHTGHGVRWSRAASPNATATYTSYTDLNVSGSPHSIAAYYQGDGTHNLSDSSASPILANHHGAAGDVERQPEL